MSCWSQGTESARRFPGIMQISKSDSFIAYIFQITFWSWIMMQDFEMLFHYWPFYGSKPADSPNKGLVMMSFDVPFDVSPNKLLDKTVELMEIWDAMKLNWHHCYVTPCKIATAILRNLMTGKELFHAKEASSVSVDALLTRLPLVPHSCISVSGQHRFR